jgi:hypothetical protein
MFYRHPSTLSARAREVLQWLADHQDGDNLLTVEGAVCYFGPHRTSRRLVQHLLECVFLTDVSDGPRKGQLYKVNEAGKRWLKGELPYCDANGKFHATMFNLSVG